MMMFGGLVEALFSTWYSVGPAVTVLLYVSERECKTSKRSIRRNAIPARALPDTVVRRNRWEGGPRTTSFEGLPNRLDLRRALAESRVRFKCPLFVGQELLLAKRAVQRDSSSLAQLEHRSRLRVFYENHSETELK